MKVRMNSKFTAAAIDPAAGGCRVVTLTPDDAGAEPFLRPPGVAIRPGVRDDEAGRVFRLGGSYHIDIVPAE